jgi:hypothetical protein
MVSLEVNHCCGIVSFGRDISNVPLTGDYERFHDELGCLDANQNRTRLFDALMHAADLIDRHSVEIGQIEVKKRIFVLTDGADNASSTTGWEVAQSMQERGIVVDCVPLAVECLPLRAICAASGGVCSLLLLSYCYLTALPLLSHCSLRCLLRCGRRGTSIHAIRVRTYCLPFSESRISQSTGHHRHPIVRKPFVDCPSLNRGEDPPLQASSSSIRTRPL